MEGWNPRKWRREWWWGLEYDSSSDEYEEQVETKGRNLTDGQLS